VTRATSSVVRAATRKLRYGFREVKGADCRVVRCFVLARGVERGAADKHCSNARSSHSKSCEAVQDSFLHPCGEPFFDSRKWSAGLSALMSSSAYGTALQYARERNVTSFRAKEKSHSRSLLLVLEIDVDGPVRMHSGCINHSFSCLCCVFRFSSLVFREKRGRESSLFNCQFSASQQIRGCRVPSCARYKYSGMSGSLAVDWWQIASRPVGRSGGTCAFQGFSSE
jgi:hypothetical protein